MGKAMAAHLAAKGWTVVLISWQNPEETLEKTAKDNEAEGRIGRFLILQRVMYSYKPSVCLFIWARWINLKRSMKSNPAFDAVTPACQCSRMYNRSALVLVLPRLQRFSITLKYKQKAF
ncbi:hypothetical protein BSAF29S_06365 [Bacillus safensis subsp. safensis]